MKKPLLVGLAGLALLGIDSARAADVAVPTYPTAAPVIVPPSYFEWFGPYMGAIGGGGFENTRTEYSYVSAPASLFEAEFGPVGPAGPFNVGGQSAVASAIAQGFLPTSLGKKATGFFTAGGLIGFNFRMAQLVYGLEGDLSWMNGFKTTSFVAPPMTVNGVTVSNNVTQSAGLRWLATVRGRVGYAIDRALIFATGGWAFTRLSSRTNETLTGTIPPTFTDVFAGNGGRSSGFAVGGGIEYALMDYLTIKGEYLYYNFGSVNYQVAATSAPTGVGQGLTIFAHQRFDGSIFRLGVNYKPDWL
jgi:outer membrane immunogenic protein